jgi:predicted alpha/beta hydrolase
MVVTVDTLFSDPSLHKTDYRQACLAGHTAGASAPISRQKHWNTPSLSLLSLVSLCGWRGEWAWQVLGKPLGTRPQMKKKNYTVVTGPWHIPS